MAAVIDTTQNNIVISRERIDTAYAAALKQCQGDPIAARRLVASAVEIIAARGAHNAKGGLIS